MLWQPLSKIGRSLKVFQEKNRARPPGRTLQKSTHDSDMYNRPFPIGNALFLIAGGMMSLFRLPRGKLAFAQRSGAMKAPVGLLSDRTVLRKQDGGALPRQVRICPALLDQKLHRRICSSVELFCLPTAWSENEKRMQNAVRLKKCQDGIFVKNVEYLAGNCAFSPTKTAQTC